MGLLRAVKSRVMKMPRLYSWLSSWAFEYAFQRVWLPRFRLVLVLASSWLGRYS